MRFVLALVLILLGIPVLIQGQKITFTEDIAPIIHNNCTPCHRPGQVAPFSLITYRDVAKRAEFIQHVTESRYMPPWKADNSYRSFANQKGLTEEEITLIKNWVGQNTPKGKGKIKLPQYSSSSSLGQPHLQLGMPQLYKISGGNVEEFVLFAIPFTLPKTKSIAAIEFVPGNLKLVHHANFGIYALDEEVEVGPLRLGIRADSMDPYVEQLTALTPNLVYYNGWIPGSSPIEFHPGIGFNMPEKGVIILTMHYAPSAVADTDQSHINFFYSNQPIQQRVGTISLGSGGIGTISPPLEIPPEEVKSFKVKVSIREAMDLLYVWPHMHLIGKSFSSYALTNAGDTINLVRINQWDFNWQEAYRFEEPLHIPAGSTFVVEGTFDNTSDNPTNPFDPPRTIYSDGLMQTTNEMLSLILIYIED